MSGPPPDADPDDVFGRPPPGWADVAGVADDLWTGSDLADEYPRPIDRIAVMRLPLFLVDLPTLSDGIVRRWLAHHRLSGRPSTDRPGTGQQSTGRSAPDRPARDARAVDAGPGKPDVPLMGCLYAHGGHGYLFSCAADPPAERRLTVAHEVAHFLLDYLRPRRRVIEALGPAAADVLDGRRAAAPAERAAALMSHVRVGPHLHLLGRGVGHDDVHSDDPVVAAAERRADALAVELVAPRARVAERLWISRAGCDRTAGCMRIGFDPGDRANDPRPPGGGLPADAAATAAELAAFFGLPPYAFHRFLQPRPAARRSPLLAAARSAVQRPHWRRETDPS